MGEHVDLKGDNAGEENDGGADSCEKEEEEFPVKNGKDAYDAKSKKMAEKLGVNTFDSVDESFVNAGDEGHGTTANARDDVCRSH